jgi:hypothetical protein
VKFQPYFESGFPHGHDQWISAAATAWATMALTLAVEHPSVGSDDRLSRDVLRRRSGQPASLVCFVDDFPFQQVSLQR